jgi:hypothetical protein
VTNELFGRLRTNRIRPLESGCRDQRGTETARASTFEITSSIDCTCSRANSGSISATASDPACDLPDEQLRSHGQAREPTATQVFRLGHLRCHDAGRDSAVASFTSSAAMRCILAADSIRPSRGYRSCHPRPLAGLPFSRCVARRPTWWHTAARTCTDR